MSLGTIKTGQYGKYYSYYYDHKWQNLGLKDQGINLTPDQIDELITKEILVFKDDNNNDVTAKLITYYNEKKKQYCKYIHYAGGSVINADINADLATLEKYKGKIVQIFSENKEYWNDKKTENFINNTLKLSQPYYCKSQITIVPTFMKVEIYYGKSRKDTSNILMTMYLKQTGNRLSIDYYHTDEYKEATEAEYRVEEAQVEAEKKAKEAKIAASRNMYDQKKAEAKHWINSLCDQIWGTPREKRSREEVLKAVLPMIQGIPNSITASSYVPRPVHEILTDATVDAFYNWANWKIEEPEYWEEQYDKLKNLVLRDLRQWYDYAVLKNVRHSIYKNVVENGLGAVVDPIAFDDALNLDVFTKFKKAIKAKTIDAPKYICYEMFLDVLEPEQLRKNILNMLKTYHEFYDFPAKDIKSLAKFIATHNLKDYYDRIMDFDEAIEVIIDHSKDKAFKKRVLSSIAGGGRIDLSFLQQKSFYFEKKAQVKEDRAVWDPIKVLDDLKALIPEYNFGSEVAVMTNVILDADGYTYTFQFYTFSEDANGKDMDGRRLQYITRLYNRGKNEKNKLYFRYNLD